MADRRQIETDRRQAEADRRQAEADRWKTGQDRRKAEQDRRKAEQDRRSQMIRLENKRRSHKKHRQDFKWMVIIMITAIIICLLSYVVPSQIGKLISIFYYF